MAESLRLEKSIGVQAYNRPFKVAYLVPVAEDTRTQWILDAVFYESYTRWGGANTLIVPTKPGDSDCLIVSLKVPLPKAVLVQCSDLKYIGVYGTSMRRIDLAAAREMSVTVTNIKGYCDKETAEFVLAEILKLARGLGSRQWRAEPVSVVGKTIGIVGLGAIGTELALMCRALGMKVLYSSNRRKNGIEEHGVEFRNLSDLLTQSDMVSLHVPPDAMVLGKKEFELLPEGTILINTSLGSVYDTKSLRRWVASRRNFLILDTVTGSTFSAWKNRKNIVISDKVAAMTAESRERRVGKLFRNLETYLGINGQPVERARE